VRNIHAVHTTGSKGFRSAVRLLYTRAPIWRPTFFCLVFLSWRFKHSIGSNFLLHARAFFLFFVHAPAIAVCDYRDRLSQHALPTHMVAIEGGRWHGTFSENGDQGMENARAKGSSPGIWGAPCTHQQRSDFSAEGVKSNENDWMEGGKGGRGGERFHHVLVLTGGTDERTDG
jgi:hypothetical protein